MTGRTPLLKVRNNSALEAKRAFADVFSQAPVEAASVDTMAATVTGAGLGTAEVASQGALCAGRWAVSRLSDKVGHWVQRLLVVVLTAVVLAFGGLAPVTAS